MLYLLDTDVVSNLEKVRPNGNLVGWLGAVDPDELAIPAAVIFEIQRGIELARANAPERAREKELWLEKLVVQRPYRILSPGVAEERLLARMYCTPELKSMLMPAPGAKRPKTGADLVIAAAAITQRAALVTFNEAHFRHIHSSFALPGLFHPGRLEWVVKPKAPPLNWGLAAKANMSYRRRYPIAALSKKIKAPAKREDSTFLQSPSLGAASGLAGRCLVRGADEMPLESRDSLEIGHN